MSLDLFERETATHMARLRPAENAQTGIWDGFVRGTGMSTMQGLAKVGRSIDMLGAVGPIAQDAFTGGTEAQDRYFKEHDEVWGRAVEYWTPNPDEVGAAGQIAGMLLSTLPLVAAAPSLAVGSMQLSIAEDLMGQGVDAGTAQAVGASQAAGLGLGIYMPIFGRTLAERVFFGGIGFNVVQGIGMRGAAEVMLKDTKAAGQFQALGLEELTLDVLLGAAFGGIVHLSPAARAQGAETWARMEAWGKGLKSSDIDALLALRQAKHLNVDSMPGKPIEPVDMERHVVRMRQALEQVVRGERVDVSDLPAPRFEADEPRLKDMAARARELAGLAENVRKEEGLAKPPADIEVPELPGLSPEHRAIEARARAMVVNDLDGMLKRYADLPGSEGGKVINTDVARELFPEYSESNATRSVNSVAVHEPASALAKAAFARVLTQPDPNGLDIVTFTAGGAGAGKTSALAAVPLASRILGASQAVYDGNLSGFRNSAQKVKQVLDAGKRAAVIFVGTDPVVAFKRALSRAMKIGRTVRQDFFVETHQGSIRTAQEMMDYYAGNDRVQFVFLDNGVGGKGEVSIVDLANAREWLRGINFDNIDARLTEVLDGELKAGRISAEVHRGVKAPVVPRAGEADGARGSEQPAVTRAKGEGQAPARRVAAPESEAPAAIRGGVEPPPPGSRGGEAAGAEGTKIDPFQIEAERVVAENPDVTVRIGEQADGTPITKSLKQYLDEVRQASADALEDAKLFEIAAGCLLGRA